MAETIEIGGDEFDTELFLGAVEQARDEEGYITGNARCGNVAVFGDSDPDSYATVANLSKDGYSTTFLGDAVDEAEEALASDEVLVFTDDTDDEVWLDADNEYEIIVDDNNAYGPLKVGFDTDDLHEDSPNRGHSPTGFDGDHDHERWFVSSEIREV